MLTIIVVVKNPFKLAAKLNINNYLHVYDNCDLFEIGTAILLAVVVLAVVMSPTQHLQLPLDYYRNIIHQCMLLNHKETILSGTSFEQLNRILPISDYLPSSSSSLLLPLTESDINSLPLLQSVSDGSDYRTATLNKIMSSIEFIKPHPKQIRFSSSNNNNSANNGSINHNNNSSSSSSNNNNNNFNASISSSSSGINLNSASHCSNNNSNLVNNNDDNNTSRSNIPIYLHNTKYISNYQNNTVSSLSHAATNQLPSSTELIEQIGPVNLVTNNNSNNNSKTNNSSGSNSSIRNNNINNSIYNNNSIGNINSNNNNSNNNSINNSSNTIKNSSLPQQHQILTNNKQQLSSNENTDIMAGIYAQKLSFTTPNIATVSNVTAAAAAAAYQFNYPHIYGRDTIYGTTAAALYSNHHLLNNRSHQLHNRNAYVGIQHEPYPSPHYVSSPVNYGSHSVPPSPVIATGISRPPSSHSPHSQSMRSINRHPTTSFINSNNSNSHNDVMTNTLCATQLRIMPDSRQHPNLTHHAINLADSEKHISQVKLPSPSEIRDKEPVRNSITTTYTHETTTPGEERFKIPSGKEGSLKHRILTRPLNCEKETKRTPSITATIVRSQTSSNTTASNFSKGVFIELANGTLRKVEDMQTEDFIQSAEKSPCHQLTNSTVVKIVSTSNSVIITFAYDKNRSKANVEVPQEHPFFVYGQGWASCNPELSLQTFGLDCQRLQIGDICISLTLRDQDQNNVSSSPTNDNLKEELLPQNLSNKPSSSIVNFSTMPTTATETIVTSRLNLTAPPSISHHLPLSVHHSSIPGLPSSSTPHLYENLSPYEMNSSMSLITKHHSPSSPITKDILSTSSYRQYLLHQQQQQHHHQQQQHRHSEQQEYHPPLKTRSPLSDTRYASRSKISGNSQMSPPLSLSVSGSRPPSNQQIFYFGPDKTNSISKQHSLVSSSTSGDGDGVSNLSVYGISGKSFISVTEHQHQQEQQQQQEQLEATNYESSLSRKRRWSAPDNICDDEQKISNKIMINS